MESSEQCLVRKTIYINYHPRNNVILKMETIFPILKILHVFSKETKARLLN